jgi:hypothetical protein
MHRYLEVDVEWQRLLAWKEKQVAKLRVREDQLTQKLKQQRMEVEHAAFEHRQTLLKEHSRLLAWQADAQTRFKQEKVCASLHTSNQRWLTTHKRVQNRTNCNPWKQL